MNEIKSNCVICRKEFMKRKKVITNRRLTRGVRGVNTVTCSKECSNILKNTRLNKKYAFDKNDYLVEIDTNKNEKERN